MSNFLNNTVLVSFLILQTFSIYVACAYPSTVTDELIHEICIHARNHTLCSATLDPLKGKELTQKPLLTLGGKTLNTSLAQAQKTAITILNLYEKIDSRTRVLVQFKLKLRYHKCHVKYSDIKPKLSLARIAMKGDHIKEVRDYVSAAMIQAISCKNVVKLQPPEKSSVPQEVGKLMDNLSILLAICENLK